MFQARRTPDGLVRPFSGAKVHGIIPVKSAIVQDLLIQCSLDPAITSITHLPTAEFRQAAVPLDAIVVWREGRRLALDLPDSRSPRNIDDDGLVLLTLAELGIDIVQVGVEQIKREPLFSNARIVWAYRRRAVPFSLRVQILHTLTEDGPLPLLDLLKSIRTPHDASAAVLALACADLVELDLAEACLGPNTIVSIRRASDGR
jgi:hypothetical protein